MDDIDTLVLRQALAWQAAGLPVLLVTVARTWGSSPRPPGSLMAINHRGETAGSVSGGCIEDDLIERIRAGGLDAACQGSRPRVLRYGISADQAHRFGLPCGGTVELVLEPVAAHSQLAELLAACQARACTERVLDLATGQVQLRPGQHDGLPRLDAQQLRCTFGPPARLILIGAGDLSRYLCQMAQALGFELIVCDPRPEARASWLLAGGDGLQGVRLSDEMPDDLVQRLQPDARTAVIALTHDPKLDDLALIDALQSPAFYVGAIGSRAHSQQRRERLRTHFELPEAALQRLRGPAGVYIGSRTPPEIALSILAEVVAARRGVALPPQARVAQGKALDDARPDMSGPRTTRLPATCPL